MVDLVVRLMLNTTMVDEVKSELYIMEDKAVGFLPCSVQTLVVWTYASSSSVLVVNFKKLVLIMLSEHKTTTLTIISEF